MPERSVVLTEYRPSSPVHLSREQRDQLRELVPGISVEAASGSDDLYVLRCGASVGVVRVGDLTIELLPKVGLAPVLFMLSYALKPLAWRDQHADLMRSPDLVEALIALFASAVQDAVRPGILHGYRNVDDVLTTVRGRIRIGDQVRTRTGLPLPVEVSYDDFTPDILENRLLRTAVDVLSVLRLRSAESRRRLRVLRHHLTGISGLPPSREVPEPHWTRLNERYRPAVALARLIISRTGLEARVGATAASAIVLDMNRVFEEFVRVALREALRLAPAAFPPGDQVRGLYLDADRRCRLQPDLSWWRHGRCVVVGDCKYKKVVGVTPNGDVYQMLAYLTALRLDTGFLVYAKGEDVRRDLRLRHTGGKSVRVRVVDVSRPPKDVLAEVTTLAAEFGAQNDDQLVGGSLAGRARDPTVALTIVPESELG